MTNSKFVKLKNQLINANSIVKIEKPVTISGVDWFIRAILDSTVCEQPQISEYFQTEKEANDVYEQIVGQLCG